MQSLGTITFGKAERQFQAEVSDWQLGWYTLLILSTLASQDILFEGTIEIKPSLRDEDRLWKAHVHDSAKNNIAVGQFRYQKIPTPHAILVKGDTSTSAEGKGVNTALRSLMVKLHRVLRGESRVLTYVNSNNLGSIKATLLTQDPTTSGFYSTEYKRVGDYYPYQLEFNQNTAKPTTLENQLAIFSEIQQIYQPENKRKGTS